MRKLPFTLLLAAVLVAAVPAPAWAGDEPAETFDLTFRDTPLREALVRLAETAGKNVIVSPDVEGTITLELRQVTWKQAIGLLAGAHDLYVTGRNGVTVITRAPAPAAAKQPEGKPSALQTEAARARAALERVEQARKRLAEAREKNAKLHAEGERLKEEAARIRKDVAGVVVKRGSSARGQPTVEVVQLHDVRDLQGKGPYPALAETIADIVRAGGHVEEKQGTLVVRASPLLHKRLRHVLRDVRNVPDKGAEARDRLAELRAEVRALRGEVRELTALVRQLLERR